MSQKLIKINTDHFVVVDDSEIKEKSGDWFYSFETGKIYDTLIHHTAASCKKITHSTQPLEEEKGHIGWDKVKYLSLSSVKALLGEVDVEKKARKVIPTPMSGTEYIDEIKGFVKGYNQALEDNKEKRYTEEDMRKAIEFGRGQILDNISIGIIHEQTDNFIQSLQPKTEWEVEIVDGKLKLK